jgi:hypothetical protein
MKSGYGIFGRETRYWAKLKFTIGYRSFIDVHEGATWQ